MSDITINLENLSRFNKRLQKALKKQFNQEIPLHIASNLFANALGVDDEYQLKKKLELNNNTQVESMTTIQNNFTTKDIFLDKAQHLLDYINSYFAQRKSLFNSFVLFYVRDTVSLRISAESKKFANREEGFGLYFEDNPTQYFKENLSKLKHSKDDLQFLDNLCKNYFTDDFDQNIYLGSRLIKLLGLNPNQQSGSVDTVFLYEKEKQ